MYRAVFRWRPIEGRAQEFIEVWLAGSDVIQASPGALGTRLFQRPDEPGVFYAMADWESAEARREAMAALEEAADPAYTTRRHLALLAEPEQIEQYELVAQSLPRL